MVTALELAARYPEIPGSIVLIDSLVFPRQSILDALQPMVGALRRPDYQAVYQRVILSLCLPTDMKHGKHNSSLLCRRLRNMLSRPRSTTYLESKCWPTGLLPAAFESILIKALEVSGTKGTSYEQLGKRFPTDIRVLSESRGKRRT